MDARYPAVARIAPLFYVGLGLLTIVAFWPSYLSVPKTGFSRFHHLHAITGTAWLAVLIAQPYLATHGRLHAHRVVGWLGCFAMAGLLIAFFGLSHHVLQGKEGDGLLIEAYLSFLRLAEGLIIATCFALAILFRKNTALHSRLMICTGLPLIDPVVHRVAFAVLQDPGFNYQLLTWGLISAVLVTFTWLERKETTGRLVFPSVLLATTVLFIPPVFKFWSWGRPFELWTDFIRWFGALPLT